MNAQSQLRALRGVRRAARPAAALLRQLRGAARQRRQPGLALLRGDEQKRPPADGAPAGKTGPTSRAAAVGFFALLPIAVALGVVVGRSNSGSNDTALLEALRRQNAAVAATSAGTTTTASAATKKAKRKRRPTRPRKRRRQGGRQDQERAVHQVTGFKPTSRRPKKTPSWSKKTPNRPGENYIKAQQNLPDVIVVGGTPNRGGASAPGIQRASCSAAVEPASQASEDERRRAARPARPAAGEVHDHAGRPRRRLLRDGDPRPRPHGRADPQGGRAAAGRRRAARGRAGARARARRRRPGSARAAAPPTATRCGSAPSAGTRWCRKGRRRDIAVPATSAAPSRPPRP